MLELFSTNDPVQLSWIDALLTDAGIDALIFDRHASIVEGSIGAIRQRVMVADADFAAAHRLLTEAGLFDR